MLLYKNDVGAMFAHFSINIPQRIAPPAFAASVSKITNDTAVVIMIEPSAFYTIKFVRRCNTYSLHKYIGKYLISECEW